tara:strand:+ start:2362 stop:2565 length:204 start_codon:yes stop_codon:yes gene_type:complete
MKSVLKIEFDNQAAANHFSHWLCGQGEQNYWIWMEEREREEDGPITAWSFRYKGDTIETECGRLDDV